MSASASQRRLLVELAAGAVVVMTVPVSARTTGGGCRVAGSCTLLSCRCPRSVGHGSSAVRYGCGDLLERTRLRRSDEESLGRSRHGGATVVGRAGAVRFRGGKKEQRRTVLARFAAWPS